jgi:uncharacterized protein YdaU (DUF1376 family)
VVNSEGQSGRAVAETTEHAPEQSADGAREDMPKPQSTKSPAFQLYPAEFLSSDNVDRMAMTERGAYITLLCKYWLAGDLPFDMEDLAGMCRMKTPQFERMWKNGRLHRCFEVTPTGRLRHDRLERERHKQQDFKRRQSDNGKKGGRPSGKGLGLTNVESGKPTESSLSLSSSSSLSSSLTVVERERPQPIIRPRRKDAAYEHESGMYVPDRVHQDLVPQHPQGFDLSPWYESVCKSWAGRPTGDLIKFWKARHEETYPPERPAAQSGRRTPSWYKAPTTPVVNQ